ncbi:MAG: PelD GGDEF domain-containing protein [Steroidobacteraceae bacterium]
MDHSTEKRYSIVVWAEVVLLPLAALMLAVWLFRARPFTASPYPWLWLVPFLLGLRYGLASAVLATLVLAAGGIAVHLLGISGESVPLIQLAGGAFAALSAGQYSSRWRERLKAARARTDYAEQRLESLTRAFFITRLSHDRLEEALITQPVTLRGALEALRGLSAEEVHGGLSAVAANALLQLLAQYCRFETAALHGYRDGRLDGEPLAALGWRAELARTDPLLTYALEHEQTAYHSVDQLSELEQGGYYRVVFPLIDSTGGRLGVLVVRDLPLLALTEENLCAAAAMLQYFADESWAAAQTADLRHSFPHCPDAFAHELIKLQRLHIRSGVRSTLVVVRARKDDAEVSALDALDAARRGLDLYWREPFGPLVAAMLILLPLAGPATTRGFLERIDSVLRAHGLEGGLEAAGFAVVQVPVDRPPLSLLRECGIEVERPLNLPLARERGVKVTP